MRRAKFGFLWGTERSPKVRRASTVTIALLAAVLAACGNDSTHQVSDLGQCTTDVSLPQTVVPELVPLVSTVQARQEAVDQFGGGFRVAADDAEIGYIHYLAAQLRALGASDVTEEPYTFTAWSAKTTGLDVLQGPGPGPVNVAYFIPASGSTGPDGVAGSLVYCSELSKVNFGAAVASALAQMHPGTHAEAIESVLQDSRGSGVPLEEAVASLNVKNKIVMYDVPKIQLKIGWFYLIATYVNNSSGTMGPATTYSRPFIDMLTVQLIDTALQKAGAVGVIGVIDYPPAEADMSYYPFWAVPANPGVPGLYLDRYTGEGLKQQLTDAGATPVQVKLTLDATQGQATSYNVSAVVPGQCTTQILVSSHSDGPNSVEDNGPAAILSIVEYFLHAPIDQRRRGLKVVFTGGHFEGSPGIAAYIAKHQAELDANVLTAIEIEHLGAREWTELTPGTMGVDGLPEPAVLYSKPGSVQQDENVNFAMNFDRSAVIAPLPFGEGLPWSSKARLPLIQFITGPVYLLNGPLPEVSSQFTDYALEQRQIVAFIQMILNLNTHTAATLRSGAIQ